MKMNNTLVLKFFFLLTLLLLFVNPADAKSIVFSRLKSPVVSPARQLKALEDRLRPYLEYRLSSRRHRTTGKSRLIAKPFDENDIQILARAWNSLSPKFKQLYLQAVEIKKDNMTFVSPGKNFEIYYSISGQDSVSITDTIMYDPQNWRIKIPQSNGIPDYVDEVAWALDSTWSMEIDRFRFNKPYPYQDSILTSDRYKISIEFNENSAEYGFTFPYKKVAQNGFNSYITIRNEWNTFDNKSFGFTYDKNPIPAIQVTCAHEFFHAIQYSMSWDIGDNTQLDNFPLSWIEGSAVTMEELAFPEANDYHMYAKRFFDNPQMSFFSSSDYLVYTNSLLLLYVSTRTPRNENAGFIHRMHFRNYSEPEKFIPIIELSSQESGFSWPQLLNKFYTASYFTGLRADTTIFISDAAQFTPWSYSPDTLTIHKIAKNATGTYSIKTYPSHSDTLLIFAGYQTRDTMTIDSSWAAAALLRTNDSTSVIPLPLDKNGKGLLTIPQWKSAKELIVTVTSGFSDKARSYDVEFVPCPITYTTGSIDTLFLDATSRRFPFVTMVAHADLRCELYFNRFLSPTLVDSAAKHDLTSADSLYEINFPTSWTRSAKLQLVTWDSINDTLLFCRWNTDSEEWTVLDTLSTNRNAPVTVNIIRPGIHGFFIREQQRSSESDIFVFPTPAHIFNGTGTVHYEGRNITEALVYSIDGALVYSARHRTASQATQTKKREHFTWTLKQSNGRIITPGVYTVLIKYFLNNTVHFHRQKILLVP